MGGNVKLKHNFVPGTFNDVSEWLTSRGFEVDERVDIAPNTSVRLHKIGGRRAVTYTLYFTDILTLVSDGSIIVNSSNTSVTTKRRLNQFLQPLKCFVSCEKFIPHLSYNGKHMRLSNDIDRVKLDA